MKTPISSNLLQCVNWLIGIIDDVDVTCVISSVNRFLMNITLAMHLQHCDEILFTDFCYRPTYMSIVCHQLFSASSYS